MISIVLPDGSQRNYQHALSVAEVAADIGSGLAKAALAGRVNGHVVDTSYTIDRDAEVAIITVKDSAVGLDIIRHSCAHLMAQAVKQLYPTVQVTIGPVIDSGFYYDFAYERAFTPDDLLAIEQRMHILVQQDQVISRKIVARDEAIQFFVALGENYKVDIIKEIPEDEVLTLYSQGDFTDLCRGSACT